MIPIGGSLGTIEMSEETSRTYEVDFRSGRVMGMIDGLDAVRQAVNKILQTNRFAYLIYDANYGSEMTGLVGKSQGYVRSMIGHRIREALLQDDRISEIVDMQITILGDEAHVTFTVVSTYGNFTQEVNAGV
ncbi:phage baseplate assembly protein W [Paenibacillus anaericanus]|uniref:DUF2634 domain-containing protein n=1 Tax=Paenibacillus anaericanus TaxID=170367 RepID=UPI0027889718|nr:DUF2634 domain-containing protein [Paenibacillus anaericanus]MDQ0090190.1 phage baseplate assembly protein W [Paenibacillus anaericanus]